MRVYLQNLPSDPGHAASEAAARLARVVGAAGARTESVDVEDDYQAGVHLDAAFIEADWAYGATLHRHGMTVLYPVWCIALLLVIGRSTPSYFRAPR